MMTLRLEKTDPPRTEFYECELAVVGREDESGATGITTYPEKGLPVAHYVGPLPGQASEAFLMNSSGQTVEVLRRRSD